MLDTPYRKIVTEIPSKEAKEVMDELASLEPRAMSGFMPVVFHKAEGFQVYDESGNKWLDFSSAVVLANAGHSHPIIKKRIQDQLEKNLWHSYCNPTRERLAAVKAMKSILPPYLDKVFLLTTGAEAVECAIKLCKIYGQSVSPQKDIIVSYYGAFHGRTMAAQRIGGFMNQQTWMGKKPEGFYHIPYPECARCPFGKCGYQNCGKECFDRTIETMRKDGIDPNRVAAFISETFQGPTVAFMPQDYVEELRAFTREIGALLVFDEVQAGIGRTGHWFGFEHYGVEPDLITLAKGMSSCLPASAVAGRAEILDLPEHGDMSSTHTGNPLSVSAVIGNIEAIKQEKMVENAAMIEKEVVLPFRKELINEFGSRIAAFNGHGVAWGICLKKENRHNEFDIDLANQICQLCLERGLMMLFTGRGTLKIAPPLCITKEAMQDGLNLIRDVMRELLK